MTNNITLTFFAAYAFAELIDNSLAATRNNTGPRNIEIRLVRLSFEFFFQLNKYNFHVCILSRCYSYY